MNNLLSAGLTAASAAAIPSALNALQKVDNGRNVWNNLDQAGRNQISSYGDAGTVANWLSGVTAANSAQMQANAREQMDFQREQNALAMAFNAAEAKKNRNWQELMSNTAHQREVRDLIAAGLNPVLAANSGAAVGSGATASGVTSAGAAGGVDTSLSAAATSMFGQVLNSLTALKQSEVSAKTAVDVERMRADATRYAANISSATGMYAADRSLQGTRYSADMGYAGSRYSADSHAAATRAAAAMSAAATRYASDNSLAASKYSSDNSLAASKYSSDKSYKAAIGAADVQGMTARAVAELNNLYAGMRQEDQQRYDVWSNMKQPDNLWEFLMSGSGNLGYNYNPTWYTRSNW